MTPKEPAKIVKPPNRIKQKIGPAANVRNMLSPENIKNGQQTIDGRKADFIEWAKDDIVNLDNNLHEIQNTAMTSQHLGSILQSAEHLRDRGGTFGYDLLSKIAKSLVNYCSTIQSPSPDHAIVVSKHIEGLKTILGNAIEGDGGAIGVELMSGLVKLTDKYKAE